MNFRWLYIRRVNGVHVKNLDRLVWILREKYPRVLEADRRFEEETNFRNKLGTNNLVDALSHIGTLFEAAPDSDYDGQRAQITLFEDHLRRTMMEAWEQMLDFQAGEIDKLWYEEYLKLARPLQASGQLPGSPSADQLDSKRKRYVRLLDEGRSKKRGPGWAEWEEGTDKFIEACQEASELREMLHESIKAAHGFEERRESGEREERRDSEGRRRYFVTIALAVVAIIVSIALGIGLGSLTGIGRDSSTTTVIEPAPAKQSSPSKAGNVGSGKNP